MRYLQIILTAGLIWTQFSADAQAVFLGPAATDEGSFTAGTSPFQPQGCFFQTTATSNPLTTGQQGSVQCTAQRAPFVNLRNSSGTEIGTSGSPLFTSLSATPSLANGNGIVQTQGGSVLSATNGTYANLLQGNAVISTGNPLFITGTGTAGTAAINPITVQGIASMTPLLVNPGTAANFGVGATGSAVPANGIYNGINVSGTLRGATGVNPSGSVYASQMDLASVAGTTAVTGTGASGAGILRVTVSNDSSLAANQSVNEAQRGGTTIVADPCLTQIPSQASVNLSAASSSQVIALSAGKKVYICSGLLLAGAADNVAVTEGTGTNCGTGNAAVFGGATAATGLNLAANQGAVWNGAGASHFHTNTAGDAMCLLPSATSQLSGYFTYVYQ